MALEETAEEIDRRLDESIRRIIASPNPVELVNNMYGCHPDSLGDDYFSRIYKSSN